MDPTLVSYKNAKSRCLNVNNGSYIDYGGRGIKFLFTSFEEFLEELGPKPIGYTLERINNDGHYEKGNVKWATRKEQVQNRRKFKSNSSGITGVHYKYTHNVWVSRTTIDNTRKYLYVGKDFFEACCARKSWENLSSIL